MVETGVDALAPDRPDADALVADLYRSSRAGLVRTAAAIVGSSSKEKAGGATAVRTVPGCTPRTLGATTAIRAVTALASTNPEISATTIVW